MLVCMSTGENENHSCKGRSLSSPLSPPYQPSPLAVIHFSYLIFDYSYYHLPPTATHVIYEFGPHCIYEGLRRYHTVVGVISSFGATDTDAGAIEIRG
jgi:hypothetical protein